MIFKTISQSEQFVGIHQLYILKRLDLNQTSKERGMEGGYLVRSLWDLDHYSSHHLLQHTTQGQSIKEPKHALLPAQSRVVSASCPVRFLQLVQVDFLQAELVKRDFTVSCMHADLDQKERDLVMRHSVMAKLECWAFSPAGSVWSLVHIHSISMPIHTDSLLFMTDTCLPRWVSLGVFPCPHFHRFAGSWDRCTTGLTPCQLIPIGQNYELWAKHEQSTKPIKCCQLLSGVSCHQLWSSGNSAGIGGWAGISQSKQ